jgi:hydroxyethylthiazole kinase
MTRADIESQIAETVQKVRAENPMAGSITNTVTINFVANAQLAVGGAAAMVYLPDEGEGLAAAGGAFYINMGTQFPVYAESLPRTAAKLHELKKPWVLDPVGIGLGALRAMILQGMKEQKPSIIRGNASEIIALANLWQLASTRANVRGVDAMDTVDAAREAAMALARWTGGAVAVSGKIDLVTDGRLVVHAYGGSKFLPMITGAGCSLGGVMAVYAVYGSPFIAALTGTLIYNLAGARAEEKAAGPGSFQVHFLDELYKSSPEDVARSRFEME